MIFSIKNIILQKENNIFHRNHRPFKPNFSYNMFKEKKNSLDLKNNFL